MCRETYEDRENTASSERGGDGSSQVVGMPAADENELIDHEKEGYGSEYPKSP